MTKSAALKFEFYLVIAFILFLPLYEAPKNLLWAALIPLWLYNRTNQSDFGGAWDLWDSLILVWILSGIAVATFAGLHHKEWSGAWDLLRYGVILWILKRSHYEDSDLRWMITAVVISTALALAWGLAELHVLNTKYTLELNSVGHVNHSAIYVTITYGAMLSALLAFWRRMSWSLRIAGIAVTALLFLGIIMSDSRAAIGTALLLSVALSAAWWSQGKRITVLIVSAAIVVGGIMAITKPEVVRKQVILTEKHDILNHREQLWGSAFVAFRKFPYFGIGMGNYSKYTPEITRAWLEEMGKPYDATRYFYTSHAHSLYMNTLSERGIVGSAALVAVLMAWAWYLWCGRPRSGSAHLDCALWGGSFSAWFVSLMIGTVNTTLHHEHALLSMLLLGLWLAYRKRNTGSGLG